MEQQLNDLILIYNQQQTINFLKYSDTAQGAKRAISWGIYFYERSDIKSARDAFVKAGELVSHVNTHLNNVSTHEKDKEAELLHIGQELCNKLVILIGEINTQLGPNSAKSTVTEHWTKHTTSDSSGLSKIINLFKKKSKPPVHSKQPTVQPTPKQLPPIPIHLQPQQPVQTIDHLKERLARVMSDKQLEQPLPPVPKKPQLVVSSKTSDKSVQVAISQIQNNLSHMLQRGTNDNHVTKNATMLVTTIENLQPLQPQIVQYLKKQKEDSDLMTRIEYQIYINVVRVLFEVNYTIKNATLVSPRKEAIQVDSMPVLELYEKFFELDPVSCKLLEIQIYAENFEHTVSHMVELQLLLNQLFELVQTKQHQYDKELTTKVSQALCHRFQTRIIDFKYSFGVDTYVSSTHDFENDDGLGSLTILLSNLSRWIEIENIILVADTSVPKLVHQWLRLAVKRMFVVNTETVAVRMIDNGQNQDRPLFSVATKLMYMCDYVLQDCTEVTQRFSSCFNLVNFVDIICVEFSLHVTADIDQYCNECYKHQNERLQLKRTDFDLSISLFHKLCPKISNLFKRLKQISPNVKIYPLCETFYEIIRRCITIPFLTKLGDYCTKAVTFDKIEQALDTGVSYTSSCVDVTTALLKPLGMITELDYCLRMNNPKNTFQSLLIVYLDCVRPIMQRYLQFLKYQFENELVGKKGDDKIQKGVFNVKERVTRASLSYNNVNGVFLQCKTVLTYFNNNHFFSRPTSNYSFKDDDEEEDYEEEEYDIMNLYVQDEDQGNMIADVFDLQCVKNMIDDIRNGTHLMATFFAQWIFNLNELRFRNLFKQEDHHALAIFLQYLDRFFSLLSDHLYLELLHEVLKHLYVLYVQHLLRILLPTSSHDFDHNCRTTVEKTLSGLKELFNADGEGIDNDFLEQYARELQVIIRIYHDDTSALIQLYKALTSDIMIQRQPSVDVGDDNTSVISDSSSDSSVMITNLQQQVIMNTISNLSITEHDRIEFLNPELVLLLLGMRRKDKEARVFVKQVIKKKKGTNGT